MGQYCLARWCLSSVVVCNAAGVGGRPPPGPPSGALAVGRPTLHVGSVQLRPVSAKPCYCIVDLTDTPNYFILCFLSLISPHDIAMPKGLYFTAVVFSFLSFFLVFDAYSRRSLNGSQPNLDTY